MSSTRILVVEDDREINRLLTRYLEKEGYQTDSSYDGLQAQDLLINKSYQLVILDLMIPGVDGYGVLRFIRSKGNIPVIILSAKDQEPDKIIGLGLGADDYMTKPFTMGELVARVKAQLRRYMEFSSSAAGGAGKVLKHGDLQLDLATCEVVTGNERKILTAKEFSILELFMSNPTRVFTKSQIFKSVWQEESMADENTVMVHIRRLRTKIEKDPSNPRYIQTVWGFGYKLSEDH